MFIRLLCRFVLVITASVQPFLGKSLSAENITLLEAYEMARESAPGLGVARYKVDLAEAERDIARGQILLASPLLGNGQKMRSSFILVIALATVFKNMRASATVGRSGTTY